MNYQEVTAEKAKELLQTTYKYMPTMIMVKGSIARVVAQKDGIVYYTKESI